MKRMIEMTEEEIIELGAKPKRTKAKSITREELDAMFAKRDEELSKKLDEMCDSCAHHECECPSKIEALDKYADERMDALDENDEALRQGINDLAKQTDGELQDLKSRLDEEHRLRTKSEETMVKLKNESEKMQTLVAEQEEQLKTYRSLLDRNTKDLTKVGAVAGAIMGLGLILVACVVAGVI